MKQIKCLLNVGNPMAIQQYQLHDLLGANHRITKWFGLAGTLKTLEFQPPHHGQGCHPLDQAALGPSSLALNTSKDIPILSIPFHYGFCREVSFALRQEEFGCT